jgi:opacity protein-like surface antigen
MSRVTRTFVLLGGIALSGLFFTTTAKAADMPVVEEPSAFGWYVGLFGGYKWGDGEVDVFSFRQPDQCPECHFFEGDLHGEVDDGWIVGGVLGARITENFRAEIEVSHARLDAETTAIERVIDPLHPVPPDFTFTAEDEDKLRELFIMANVWFGIPISAVFSPYIGGGVGVAHVDAEFGVDTFGGVPGFPATVFSASIEADDWSLAYQLGAGVLIGLSENIAIDLAIASRQFQTSNWMSLNSVVARNVSHQCSILNQTTTSNYTNMLHRSELHSAFEF